MKLPISKQDHGFIGVHKSTLVNIRNITTGSKLEGHRF
ncbi:hypothetical protein [Dyadobacter sp. BHUBP1]